MRLEQLKDYTIEGWFYSTREELQQDIEVLRKVTQKFGNFTDLELLLIWEKFCNEVHSAGYMHPCQDYVRLLVSKEFVCWMENIFAACNV